LILAFRVRNGRAALLAVRVWRAAVDRTVM
jgi:hypothetical protein